MESPEKHPPLREFEEQLSSQAPLETWNRFLGHLLPSLRCKIIRSYRWVDEQMVDECIDDALLNLWAYPEQFNPLYRSLFAYLWGKIRGFLANRLRSHRRRNRREKCVGVFERDFVNNCGMTAPGRKCVDGEEGRGVQESLLKGLSLKELAEVDLLAERVPKEQWVKFLGLDALPEAERSWRVYREKERLRRKLRRRWKSGGA